MLIRQRRTQDLARRKELIFEIQRYLAKNYAPNFGYDYGGRLMAAWLER